MKKPLSFRSIKKTLELRLLQVGSVRDKLRDDIYEMEALKESCDKAYESIESAIDALSELA